MILPLNEKLIFKKWVLKASFDLGWRSLRISSPLSWRFQLHQLRSLSGRRTLFSLLSWPFISHGTVWDHS